jgi:hypothetical protein
MPQKISRGDLRRADLAGHELPSSIKAFVDNYLGAGPALTLRLAERCLPRPRQPASRANYQH